jgi:SAM-dependent methyltransferase
MKPAPVEHCRVLEIGCAAGTNLLPMAAVLPHSTFVGVDLSQVHVDTAKDLAHAADLHNVQPMLADILQFPPGQGTFDFIIAHGIFSWVPDDVKQAILRLCGELLTDQGIACISYNCYPGWSHRAAICDLLRLRLQGVEGFDARTSAAWETLNVIDKSLEKLSAPHAAMTRDIIRSMRQKSPNTFFHDEIGTINDPCYFLQFVEWAAEHGLQYLSDSMLATMLYENLPEGVRASLESLRLDHLQLEQFMDFLRNRMFRSTLLCRKEARLDRRISRKALRTLRFRSLMHPRETPDLRPGVRAEFTSEAGHGVSSDQPAVKRFLMYLASQSPRFVPFKEAAAHANGPAQTPPDSFVELTLELLAKELMEVSAFGVNLPQQIPHRPAATKLAREQSKRTGSAVNLVHQLCVLAKDESGLMARLDGSIDAADFDPKTLERLHKRGLILPAALATSAES